jgi:hypothetical protein
VALVSLIFDAAARTAFSEEVAKAASTAALQTNEEKRWTLAPVYVPERRDAHQEATSSEALEEAINEFAKSGDKRLLLQHGDAGEHYVGTIMSVFCWPFPATVEMTDLATMEKTKHTFPANTAWAWVEWDEDAWKLVKAGKLRGYSMGGRAVRRLDPSVAKLDHMGYDIRKSDELKTLLAELEDSDDERVVRVDDGYLVADEEAQAVYRVTTEGIEILHGGER